MKQLIHLASSWSDKPGSETPWPEKSWPVQWRGLTALALLVALPGCVNGMHSAAHPHQQVAYQAEVHQAEGHEGMALGEGVQEDQAEVMKTCQVNATAMNLEGDTREYYLNGCLLAPVRTHAAHKQCQVNATAMNLEGDTRRHYLLSCLARN